MKKSDTFPGLDPRFLQPDGWRWHIFTLPDGRRLRFGTAAPKGKIPDAVVVCLPGLSEFSEKYFELAQNLLDRNLSLWVLDWMGQGKSDRYMKNNPHKRHSVGFDRDLDDLHFFIMEYVKHACVHPDVGRIPMVMLAHSMGANIGLRYLIRHPDIFAGAAFTAPMVGIYATKLLPGFITRAVSWVLNFFVGSFYVPKGSDWNPEERDDPNHNIFSTDPIRKGVHNAWYRADPALQVGSVTFGWVYHALQSCAVLQHEFKKSPPTLPILVGLAKKEILVDNDQAVKLLEKNSNVTIIEFPDSFHEILMEKDDIRGKFIDSLGEMLQKNNVQEKLKPF